MIKLYDKYIKFHEPGNTFHAKTRVSPRFEKGQGAANKIRALFLLTVQQMGKFLN